MLISRPQHERALKLFIGHQIFGNLPQLALATCLETTPYNTKFGNLAPRGGVAYNDLERPGGGKPVVRGGWEFSMISRLKRAGNNPARHLSVGARNFIFRWSVSFGPPRRPAWRAL